MSSARLKEGESVNANHWKTEFGSNEAAKEMVGHVGKHCSHFITEEQYRFIHKKMKVPSELSSNRNVTRGFFSRTSVAW